MELQRSAGILLHPTSLPGGVLDEHAYRFVDWLAEAGQSWWQMLPLGPPDPVGSPYKSESAFAAWPGLLGDPEAPVEAAEAESYRERNAYWLEDWLAFAGEGALADQVRFDREWRRLRAYAAERGVRLIGDVPIYVAPGSADHVRHPELFQTGWVAGAPPDPLGPLGQLWENPLYDWDAVAARGYRWWVDRLRHTFELFDLTRIDHFRGFAQYWAVREGSETAVDGEWREGPRAAVFRAAEAELGTLPVIAEDLGVITPDVVELRRELGFPGMVVLQFAFDHHADNPHKPQNHEELSVVYTGTHDTDTTRGWWESLPAKERARIPLPAAEPHWGLAETAYASPARLAILPAQDVLGLGSEARMNRPGEEYGNWTWRLEPGELTREHASRLRDLAGRFDR
ncbi:MAG TPA: 4-alpha-glucanotransferase [Gaiellaceae bacterium]